MDDFILGLVDFLVAICRYVYRKGFTWSYHSRIYCRGAPHSNRLYHYLDGLLGNAALFSIIHEHQTTLIQAVQQDSSVALFEFLGHLPWSGVMNILATILVVLFFVTSADSGHWLLTT